MNVVYRLADGSKPHNGEYVEVDRYLVLVNTRDLLALHEQQVTEVVVVKPRSAFTPPEMVVAVEGDPEKITEQVATAAKKTTKEARR